VAAAPLPRVAAQSVRPPADPPDPSCMQPGPRGCVRRALLYMTIICIHQATPPHIAAPNASKTTKKEKYPERDANPRARAKEQLTRLGASVP
jgi:hypothetical protein